jgi:hypothetical protein
VTGSSVLRSRWKQLTPARNRSYVLGAAAFHRRIRGEYAFWAAWLRIVAFARDPTQALRMRQSPLTVLLGFAWIGGSPLLAGCSNADERPATCASDEDCPGDSSCSVASGPSGLGPAKRLSVAAPPPPCPFIACEGGAECTDDMVCAAKDQAGRLQGGVIDWCPQTVCALPCATDDDCLSSEICRETGRCEVLRCDEEGGPTCAAEFVCEPGHAEALPDGCRRSKCDEPGSALCAAGYTCEPEAPEVNSLGCRQLRCDEPGAVDCNASSAAGAAGQWECDPSSATAASGCVPVSCTTSGRCHSDDYICEPTSSAGRSMGTDLYGCVRRNCEEGLECYSPLYPPEADGTVSDEPINIGYCDFAGPEANVDGCAKRHCTELEQGCAQYELCDAESDKANARGCRPLLCNESGGPSCGSAICEPGHRRATRNGCRGLTCEELPDYRCPTGTECNSNAVNADPAGCAPPGDAELPAELPAGAPAPSSTLDSPPSPEPSSTQPMSPDLDVTSGPSTPGPDPESAEGDLARAPSGANGVCTERE